MVDRPESPSQIPDSQPTIPKKFGTNLLDITQKTPSPSHEHDDKVPSFIHASTPKHLSRIYQPTVHPPRAASLEPLLPNSPAPTDCSISPDHQPNKFPLFTSTPKSKPLKGLLPYSVYPLCIEVDYRKSSRSHIQRQKSIATIFLYFLVILLLYFPYLSSDVNPNHEN